MRSGSIELLAVKFPGTGFPGEIMHVLDDLVDRGTRVVDLVFASRSPNGVLRTLELEDLEAESVAALEPLIEDVLGLLSEEDVTRMGAALPNGSSAGLMLLQTV